MYLMKITPLEGLFPLQKKCKKCKVYFNSSKIYGMELDWE